MSGGGEYTYEVLRSEPFLRYDRNVVGGQLADGYLRQHGIKFQFAPPADDQA